jgi:hypothetical protein
MSKKFSITLSDGIYRDLVRLSKKDGERLASKAVFFVETAITEARERGELDGLPIEDDEPNNFDLVRSFFDNVAAGRFYSNKDLTLLAAEMEVDAKHLIAHQNCFKKKGGSKVGD